MALVGFAAEAQQTAITRFARYTGNVNFVATGGSLRTQPNTGDACAVGASSTQALAGIPAGASIVAAYLYWGGSGGSVDASVVPNGQAVAAQRTFTATFDNGGTDFPYFGGFADVTHTRRVRRHRGDGNGVDPAVTALRTAPSGALAGASGGNQPSFAVEFRVCVR